MGQRNLEGGTNYGKKNVYLDFSFLTNGTSAIALSSLRGVGADTVLSITRAAAGVYLITFKDNYRYFIGKTSELEDIANPGDGAYATSGPVTGEGGTGSLTFHVFTRATAGTLTDFGAGGTGAARRVYISGCLKNSTVGV